MTTITIMTRIIIITISDNKNMILTILNIMVSIKIWTS